MSTELYTRLQSVYNNFILALTTVFKNVAPNGLPQIRYCLPTAYFTMISLDKMVRLVSFS